MVVAKLSGLRILVTRPGHQARGLCQAIENQGGTPILFPVLEIAEPADITPLKQLIDRLDKMDAIIFISVNAVEKALGYLKQFDVTLPKQAKIAAVGRATRDALEAAGITVHLQPPQQFDSEGLLALPELEKIEGKEIAIFRGVGGRETLADTLRKRGAHIHYGECYRRVKPKADGSKLKDQRIDIALLTSNQGLENLMIMVGAGSKHWLTQLPLVVMSERNRLYAKQLGYKGTILVSHQASDESLLAAIAQWKTQQATSEKTTMSDKDKQAKPAADKPQQPSAKPPQPQTKPPTPPPTKPPEPRQTSRRPGHGRTLAVGIICLLLLGAGGYYLWMQQQQHAKQSQQALAQLQVGIDQRLEQLQTQLTRSKQEHNLSLQQLTRLEQENRRLATAMANLQSQLGSDSDTRPWQFAEAEYLLRIANHRLVLARDVTTAIAALQSADAIIQALADPLLQPVRDQIARETTALQSFRQPDMGGISAKLVSLSEQVRELPLTGGYSELSPQAAERPDQQADGMDWQAVMDRTLEKMKGLVVITRDDKPVEPLLAPEQQQYLRYNLRLQLENARLAALQQEQALWENSLQNARDWIYDYFDTGLPSVLSTVETLEQLKQTQVAPRLPDISQSLRTLRQLRSQLDRQDEQSAVAPAISPSNEEPQP